VAEATPSAAAQWARNLGSATVTEEATVPRSPLPEHEYSYEDYVANGGSKPRHEPGPKPQQQSLGRQWWALAGVGSLNIDLAPQITGTHYTFGSLGVNPRLRARLVDTRRLQALAWAVALALGLAGLLWIDRSTRFKVRFLLAVLLVASALPLLTGMTHELGQVCDLSHQAIADLLGGRQPGRAPPLRRLVLASATSRVAPIAVNDFCSRTRKNLTCLVSRPKSYEFNYDRYSMFSGFKFLNGVDRSGCYSRRIAEVRIRRRKQPLCWRRSDYSNRFR